MGEHDNIMQPVGTERDQMKGMWLVAGLRGSSSVALGLVIGVSGTMTGHRRPVYASSPIAARHANNPCRHQASRRRTKKLLE